MNGDAEGGCNGKNIETDPDGNRSTESDDLRFGKGFYEEHDGFAILLGRMGHGPSQTQIRRASLLIHDVQKRADTGLQCLVSSGL